MAWASFLIVEAHVTHVDKLAECKIKWASRVTNPLVDNLARVHRCELDASGEALLRVFASQKRHPLDVLRVVEAAGKRHWVLALAVLNSLRRLTTETNCFHYTSIISACRRAAQWPKILEIISAMVREQVESDFVTYSSAMNALSPPGRWKQAVELLDDVVRGTIEVDTGICNAVISSCENAGAWQKALEIFHMMTSSKDELHQSACKPNINTYNAAISASSTGRQTERAWELMEELRTSRLEPDVITYNAAVTAGERGRQAERAVQFLVEMRACGLQPNVVTYSAAISACTEGRRPEQALQLFEEMQHAGVAPDEVIYSAVLGANSLLQQLPTTVPISSALRGLSSIGRNLDERPSLPSLQCLRGQAGPWNEPHALVNLPDRFVLYKPPDWEVHDQHLEDERQLSTFLGASIPGRFVKLLQDPVRDRGFLHRLDVPSSGLITAARTYGAYYNLLAQLVAGIFAREYTVVCRGCMPRASTAILVPILYPKWHECSTASLFLGKSSQTRIKALAQWN